MAYYFEDRLGSRNTASNIIHEPSNKAHVVSREHQRVWLLLPCPSAIFIMRLHLIMSGGCLSASCHIHFSPRREDGREGGEQALSFSECDLKVAYIISIEMPFART